MNQADVTRLISKLRIKIKPRHRNMKNPDGPVGRLNMMREHVNAIVKYERIEVNFNRAEEARGYVERVSIIESQFVFYCILFIHGSIRKCLVDIGCHQTWRFA